jgi:hypothetical protein
MISPDRATNRRPPMEVGRTVSTNVARVPGVRRHEVRRFFHRVAHPADGDPQAHGPLELLDHPRRAGGHAATTVDERPAETHAHHATRRVRDEGPVQDSEAVGVGEEIEHRFGRRPDLDLVADFHGPLP